VGGIFYYVRAFFYKNCRKIAGTGVDVGLVLFCCCLVLIFFCRTRYFFFLLLKLKQELFENERHLDTACQHCLQTARQFCIFFTELVNQ